jgi:hypothetical protein
MILDTHARVGGYKFHTTLAYDTNTPDIIEFRFNTRTPVRWLIGRDLLADGLMRLNGDGNIQIEPSPATDEVAIHVCTPASRAIIRLPWDPVAGFVRASYDRVARGAEYVDVDWDQLLPTAGGAS